MVRLPNRLFLTNPIVVDNLPKYNEKIDISYLARCLKNESPTAQERQTAKALRWLKTLVNPALKPSSTACHPRRVSAQSEKL
jgi:hypothetical protein